MNYPNYIGSTEGYQTASTSPQSFMMYDIAALQHMYGASFDRVGQTDTYSWSATTGAGFIDGVSQGTPVDNHIFQTIWTGGATATYDLSNFAQDQVDDMNPGGWMSFSTAQLAHLNAYAPAKTGGDIYRARQRLQCPAGRRRYALADRQPVQRRRQRHHHRQCRRQRHPRRRRQRQGQPAAPATTHYSAGPATIRSRATPATIVSTAAPAWTLLAGGAGKDVFAYAVGYGADTILDFLHADSDAIDFTAMAGLRSVGDLTRPRASRCWPTPSSISATATASP